MSQAGFMSSDLDGNHEQSLTSFTGTIRSVSGNAQHGITFVGFSESVPYASIYKVNWRGLGLQSITGALDVFDSNASWLTDDIAFSTSEEVTGGYALYHARLNGSEILRYSQGGLQQSFSNDGGSIVYV